MAEGLQSYIERRRKEGAPLQFSNMGPGKNPQSWDTDPGSTYFRPEQTWNTETEAELKKPASGFDYSEDIGQRLPVAQDQNVPHSRGSILNIALGELQNHIPGIVQHTLGGKKAPSTDEEKKAVQQNIKTYFNMILKDVGKSAKKPSQKQKEFEYYKGLSRADKAAYEGIYGKKEKPSEGSFAQKEQYKYLVNRLKGLDEKLNGEFSEDLTDDEKAQIQNERNTVLEGMMSMENQMGNKKAMSRASSPAGNKDQIVDKRTAIQQAVDSGAKKEDIINYIKQNPNASVQDFLTNFGVAATSKKKINEPLNSGSTPLNPRSEKEFQDWYKNYSDQLGLNPNPDDPRHFYDYRAAFLQGAEPNESGHWPSEFKLEGHPNMVVNGINTKTGQPAMKTTVGTEADRMNMEDVPDIKNAPINASLNMSDMAGGLQRKNVPFQENPLAAPTEEQKIAAKQELTNLASKLGIGPEDWKAAGENYAALGKLAKEFGGWAWDAYTRAIGTLLQGQEEARQQLPAYRGQ